MRNFDICRSRNIGYSTSDAQYTVVDTCREMKSLCRRYGDLSSGFWYIGELVDIDIRHLRVAMDLGSCESCFLCESSLLDDTSELLGSKLCFFVLDFSDFHPRHLDKYIHTIEYWSWESRSIPLYRMRTTTTCFLGVTHVSTWTGIHRSDEGESTWIPTARIDTIDRDFAIFERLSESLEERLIEFEKLVKKEYPLMGEWNLPWLRISSSSDDRSLTRGMMYDTKWSFSDKRHLFREESCYWVYFREFYLLFDFHRRKYPWEGASEHRLSWSWRSLHEDIVSTSCWYEEGAFRLFLTVYWGEVDRHRESRKARDIEFFSFF